MKTKSGSLGIKQADEFHKRIFGLRSIAVDRNGYSIVGYPLTKDEHRRFICIPWKH